MRKIFTAVLVSFILLGCAAVHAHAQPGEVCAPYAEAAPSPLPVFEADAAEPEAPDVEALTPLPSPAPEAADTQTLRVLHGGEVYYAELREYLLGVVAAEMPADFEPEALKAQAVAARTFALYCADTGRHSDADVCTSSACCQAWLGDDALRERWGERYDELISRITQAVDATAGEYLSYDGEAIFAAFHSSSSGRTEECGAIWGALPYLVSVDSPETPERVPGLISGLEISVIDFRDTLLHECPSADFTGDAQSWLGDLQRDGSGRVKCAVIGGAEFSGTALRRLFSLRSTCFELEYTGDSFLFTVSGFGHGVGMSQHGANIMAQDGADYREILAHYYPGTVIL